MQIHECHLHLQTANALLLLINKGSSWEKLCREKKTDEKDRNKTKKILHKLFFPQTLFNVVNVQYKLLYLCDVCYVLFNPLFAWRCFLPDDGLALIPAALIILSCWKPNTGFTISPHCHRHHQFVTALWAQVLSAPMSLALSHPHLGAGCMSSLAPSSALTYWFL